jgi:hypothetical protein
MAIVYNDDGAIEEVLCDACLEHAKITEEYGRINSAVAAVRVPESVHPDCIMDVCGAHLAMVGSYLSFVDDIVSIS